MESLLSLRLSRRFSPTGLDMGLMQAELLETPAGLAAPPAATVDTVQGTPSPLARFSTFTLTVCRLRADGGGRSPKSFKNKSTFQVSDLRGRYKRCLRKSKHNRVFSCHLLVCVQEKAE